MDLACGSVVSRAARWPVWWRFLGRLACGIAAALIFLHIGYGSFRLSTAASPVTDVGFRLVQANIPQREKWALQYRARNIMAHYQLSREDSRIG